MACRLFGAKPLPEPMLAYCSLDFPEQISVKFKSEFYHSHSRKCAWNCRLPKCRPFCPGGDELIISLHRLRKCLVPNKRQAIIWATDGIVYQGIYIDGLVQDCSNCSALAMELLQSCTKPATCLTLPQWLMACLQRNVGEDYFCHKFYRDLSGHGLNQWEKTFHSNASSHWLSPYTEWSLF